MRTATVLLTSLLSAFCINAIAWAQGALPVPHGTGPGVHSPNSPFAPLPQRKDVVPWSLLTSITTRIEKNRVLPAFTSEQLALNQKPQRIQGFMMPLGASDKQTHFLLSSIPLTCGFCVPGGPESMIEVRTKAPVSYSMEPLVIEGKFLTLKDDPNGIYYRLVDAARVD